MSEHGDGITRARVAAGLRGVPDVDDLRRALAEPRVIAAMQQTFRDIGLRATFRELRREGRSVAAAVAALRGPHHDAEGAPYYLSAERVRSIVYEKGGRRGSGVDLDADEA